MTFNWQRKGNEIGFLFYLWSFRHDLNVQNIWLTKTAFYQLNYGSIWSGWRVTLPLVQLGRLAHLLLCYNRITVPQRHSITKLNHFIASPRFISLYYIMYLFISCNIFISQGLPYVKTFLIPYVNQSGLSHCPITFSTFRLLNANKRTSIEDIKLTLFIIKYGDTYITNYLCVLIHI